MINGKRVVAWTPYGREDTVAILSKYLRREFDRGLVDEWWLCMNTNPRGQEGDIEFANDLGAANRDFIRFKGRPAGCEFKVPLQRNTGYFYRYMTDPDTVYVRIDDDIVYIHDDAIQRLVDARLYLTPTAVFPLMWNNAIVSWFAQQAGVIPAGGAYDDDGYVWPSVGGPYCMDSVGWANGHFAVKIHELLLSKVSSGRAEDLFLYQDFALPLGEQYSVSIFASLGKMYAALDQPGVLVPDEEEHWHSVHNPRVTNQPNVLIGNSLFSHYTFKPQRSVVQTTNILDQYRDLAARSTQ